MLRYFYFILFPFFLFADVYFYYPDYPNNLYRFGISFIGKITDDTNISIYNSKPGYYGYDVISINNHIYKNPTQIKVCSNFDPSKFSYKVVSTLNNTGEWGYQTFYILKNVVDINPSTCDKKCNNGYVYSFSQEKCIFDCSDKNMRSLGAKKCGGENYIKSYSCSNDGNYSITCYTCAEIMNLAQEYCKQNGGYTLKDGLTCSAENGKITTNLNFPDFNLSICNIPDNNNTDINNSKNYDSNDTNTSILLTDTNTSNNPTLINSLNAFKNQLHNDNQNVINSLNDFKNQLHNDNQNIANNLNQGFTQLHNDNKDIKSDLVGINNTNTRGFARLHSDLQGIDKNLNELNNSISILGNLKQIINNTSWLDNVKGHLTQGINKYKNYNFVTSDASTSDICLKDVSFTLYGKTIILKVSEIANSIYVKIVKAVLWLSASLLIFFTCFRTD